MSTLQKAASSDGSEEDNYIWNYTSALKTDV